MTSLVASSNIFLYYVVSLHAVLFAGNKTTTTSIALTEAEYAPEFKLTKGTPYLLLTGELWGVYSEDVLEKVIVE